MTAIITGDIINSKDHKTSKWLPLLKQALSRYGTEPLAWEIYRGDSFQLETSPEQALEAALYIKAHLKQIRHLDVRVAIGLGEKDYVAEKITESNGTAFVRSGECFDGLKKQTLAINSDNEAFDTTMNLILQLATLTMDNWLPATAKIVCTAMENPEANQKEIATLLDKSQSTISEALIRAGFDEVQKMIHFYRTQLAQL
ncbi:transcriptional regulator [Flagellimonas aequoris]|uniref:Transcriptional regulator n=1 Tax=Flagellimonas aequoris TaxID=2306997 RepID=A0A418N724_9FLAO|nr:transcriptional regulator [Allomuricauda aequoris]RIV70487.1 transcriptional regulator [Allomuricauda aequoris]TXK01915.1 transcriptional regulator [Allomuricauda aequoris]